jgi:hypothetical protein
MTVIYNMSIDRADKPWIGDRRRGAQRASDRRSKISQSKCPANSHGRPAGSPEWGWQRRKLSRWGGSCPTGLGGAEPARTCPVLPDTGEPLLTCSHAPPTSEGVSKLIRPIKPTGVLWRMQAKTAGTHKFPQGWTSQNRGGPMAPIGKSRSTLGETSGTFPKLRERSRSCGNIRGSSDS